MRTTILAAGAVAAPNRLGRMLAAVWPVASAIVLGLAILFVVGFAPSETIHNAAHDVRHSLNFPCH